MKKLRIVLSTLLVLVSLFTGCVSALADFTAKCLQEIATKDRSF